MTVNRSIRLARRPHGAPVPEDFELAESAIPTPGEGQALVRTRYLSLDPYMRGRMSDAKSYAAPLEIGDVIIGGTVGEVVASNDPKLAVGDVVQNYGGWQDYSLTTSKEAYPVDESAAPASASLGILGMTGFTAYSGLLAIGKPQAGETVAVAAASGPVGSAVGQIAKIKGCRTVGIAGGPEKVAYLKEIGFDVALDHKEPDLRGRLKEACPEGIDVYFENVGGQVWDAVLPRLNTYARVPVCGLIANYNRTEAPSGPDRSAALMASVLTKSLTLRGFIQLEFVREMYRDFLRDTGQWVAEGKISYREDITEGLENAPETFIGMLEGRNFGKTIIKVAD